MNILKKILFLDCLFFSTTVVLAFEPYEGPNGKVVLADFSKNEIWEVIGASTVNFNEKTPDLETAITYEVKEEGKKSVFRPKGFFEGKGEWRNRKFKGVSFWIKGDGSGSYIQLRLLTEEGEFQYQFYLINNEWEYKRLTWDKFTNKEMKKIDISKIKAVYFRSTRRLKVSIGPLELEPGDENFISFSLLEIPSILAFYTEKPPKIDGMPDENCWKLAIEYKLLYCINSNIPPKEMTMFKLLYDENNLYFSAILDCKDTSKLKTTRKKDGNDVYLDDCLELFINSNRDMQTYHHFMVNSQGYKGTIRKYYDKVKDSVIIDTKWVGNWEVKCKIEDKWYIEGAIPISEVMLKKNLYGESVFFQVGRENHTSGEYSSVFKTDRFPSSKNFGLLTFVLPSNKHLKFDNIYLEKTTSGKFKIEGILFSDTGENEYEIFAEIISPVGQRFFNKKLIRFNEPANNFSITLDYPSECEGEHRICLKAVSSSGIGWKVFKFQNFLPETTKYGDIIINPHPKNLQWGDGFLQVDSNYKIYLSKNATERTEKTAKFLSDELNNFTGLKFEIIRSDTSFSNYPVISIVKPEICFSFYNEKIFIDLINEIKNLQFEGYSLFIDEKGIIIIGCDEAGLYYGVVSLMQIVKGSLLNEKKNLIKKCKIIDYPDLKYRYYHESPGWGRKKEEKEKVVKWYKEYIKNFVAGQKFNMLCFNIDNQFTFSNPDLNTKAFITKDQYLEIAEFCKDHFIEFIPSLETGGHFNWVPKNKFPQFFEDGFTRQANVSHPHFYKFIFPVMQELIPEGCKYFNICHDEWWASPSADVTDKLNGIPRKEIFLKYVLDQYKWLREKGIRPMMYGDMLLKNHNGDDPGARKGLYEITKLLPNDIIIINWSSGVDPDSNKFFHNLGFEVICASNGFRPCVSDRNIVSGFGMLCYGFSFLMSGIVNDDFTLNYGYTSLLRTADYAWNIKNDTGFPVQEFERNKGKNVCAIGSVKPNPHRSSAFQIISLRKYVNSNLKDITGAELKISSAKNQFGFIPMEILKPKENEEKSLIVLNSEEKPIDIEINEPFSSIYFLHGCYIPKEKREEFFKQSSNFIWGVPIATYTFVYEDNTWERTEARFGLNILDISPPNLRSRYMSDIRYFWEGENDKEQPAFLYQYEWVNPNPNKKIKKIILQKTDTEAIAIIFAITARNVRWEEK